MQFLDALKQNPALVAVLWLMLSALLTAVFGPHSPEQMAGYPSWAQKALRVTGALGIDVPKLIRVLRSLGGGPGPLAILIMIWFSFTFTGCASWTKQDTKAAEQAGLSLAQIACVFGSVLTDAPALAEACAIDKSLSPVLEQLIGQREAAKRQGVHYMAPAADGGK